MDSTGLELEKQTTTTEYDPEGHTRDITNTGDEDTDIRYVYDADHNLIARIRKPGALDTDGAKPRLYFYWGRSGTRAEEVQQSKTATGYDNKTKIRYLVTADAQVLAQQSFDDLDQPTWTWLLRDSDGNVATHVKNNGDITRQRAYDPYGAPDEGGSAKTQGEPDSSLGYQGAPTDDVTGNVFLGPRIYDPKINRFTTADYFVGSSSDLSLGIDPLTGNRYLFAAANPVAFDDDGYAVQCGQMGCEPAGRYTPPRSRLRSRAENDPDLRRALHAHRSMGDVSVLSPFYGLEGAQLRRAVMQRMFSLMDFRPQQRASEGAIGDWMAWLWTEGRPALGSGMQIAGRGLATAAGTAGMLTRLVPHPVAQGVSGALTLAAAGGSGVAAVGGVLKGDFRGAAVDAGSTALTGSVEAAERLTVTLIRQTGGAGVIEKAVMKGYATIIDLLQIPLQSSARR